jgi:hypothetical protein
MPPKRSKKKRRVVTRELNNKNTNNIHIEINNKRRVTKKPNTIGYNTIGIPKGRGYPQIMQPTTIINQLPNPNETIAVNSINSYASMMREMRDELSQLRIQQPERISVLNDKANVIEEDIRKTLPMNIQKSISDFASITPTPQSSIYEVWEPTVPQSPSLSLGDMGAEHPHYEGYPPYQPKMIDNPVYNRETSIYLGDMVGEHPNTQIHPRRPLSNSDIVSIDYRPDPIENYARKLARQEKEVEVNPNIVNDPVYKHRLLSLGHKISNELKNVRKVPHAPLDNLLNIDRGHRRGMTFFKNLGNESAIAIEGIYNTYEQPIVDES